MRRLFAVALLLAGCAGKSAPPGAPSTSAPVAITAAGPGWAREGDSKSGDGNTFVCQGEGKTEEEALSSAQAICNDKVCKLCGVEVESVVQTTESLKGVAMQRKVVERCRRFRKSPPKVLHKTSDCGTAGCVTWLSVFFSKDDEKAECSAFASEHFADPAECQRLIDTFRSTPGRTAESFRTRRQLLDEALVACKDIDVRPTPLVDSLHEKLFAGMDVFEFTSDRQQARLEEPFFDTTWYKSRTDMMNRRGTADWYLTTYQPLRQQIRETPTLVGRIQLVRDYVHNRSLVFDVIEATTAPDLDSPAGVKRLLAALRAAPLGKQYGSPDVHFVCQYVIGDLRTDANEIGRFYRDTYPPESLSWVEGIPFANLFAKDGKVDEAEWKYVFDLHRKKHCPVCVGKLLETRDHGGAKVRDERFFAALEFNLARAKRPDDRKRFLTETMPRDPEYVLHLATLLPADLRGALDWKFFWKRLETADEANDVDMLKQLLSVLSTVMTQGEVNESACNELPDQIESFLSKGGAVAPAADRICACLTGPMAQKGTRVLVSKSHLYDYALARGLPCVRPR